MAVFCPCSKNLCEGKLQSFDLVSKTEISRQPSIDSVTWLLVIILVQVYIEKEQMGQSVYFGNKKRTRKFNVGAWYVLKKVRRNEIKRVVPLG